MSYFKNFNRIDYNGKTSINLLNRAKINSETLNLSTSFFPYELREKDRIDHIAYYAYEDPYKDWLIMYANSIVDPYYDWYLSSEDFDSYISNKYGSFENAVSNIEHCQATTLSGTPEDENIDHYEAEVTPLTKLLQGANNTYTYSDVNSYTVENQNNLYKRFINVMEESLVPQAVKELEKIFKDGWCWKARRRRC